MATNKTINPTNVTVQIPAMADKPNQAVNSNCIDKIIDGVNSLNSSIATTTADYSYSYTISANGDISITAGQMGMNSVPTGYQPRAISFYNTGNVNVFARGINSREVSTNSNCIWLHNTSNSQVTATMTVTVFYTKV